MARVSGRAIWFGLAVAIFSIAWILLIGATSHLPDNPNDLTDTTGIHISSIAVVVLLVMGGLWFAAIALLWGMSKFPIAQGKYVSRGIRAIQGTLLVSLGAFGAVSAFEYGADNLKGIASGLFFSLLVALAFVPFRYLRNRLDS